MTSVTQTLAEWIAGVDYDDVPDLAVQRVEERLVDTLGVQLAGISTSTGQSCSATCVGPGSCPRELRGGLWVQDHGCVRHTGERHSRTRTGVR